MSHMHESYLALDELLQTCFDDEELRRLAFAAFPDAELYNALPGAGASRSEVALDLVLEIQKRYTAPPTSLWSYLYEERPHRRAEIEQLERRFVPAPQPATPACPTPPQRPVARGEYVLQWTADGLALCPTAACQSPLPQIVAPLPPRTADLLSPAAPQ
jgi:hypothetical protein